MSVESMAMKREQDMQQRRARFDLASSLVLKIFPNEKVENDLPLEGSGRGRPGEYIYLGEFGMNGSFDRARVEIDLRYHPIRIRIHDPEYLRRAESFALEYQRGSGEVAILQDCYSH